MLSYPHFDDMNDEYQSNCFASSNFTFAISIMFAFTVYCMPILNNSFGRLLIPIPMYLYIFSPHLIAEVVKSLL